MASADDVKVGPWGGDGGSPWTFRANGKIVEIRVASGDYLDSVQFTYIDHEDATHVSERYGGDGGSPEIVIFAEDEDLIGISGTISESDVHVISSLSFTTNKRTYGPYGPKEGTSFTVPVTKGKIVGFYGNCGELIDSIGVIVLAV